MTMELFRAVRAFLSRWDSFSPCQSTAGKSELEYRVGIIAGDKRRGGVINQLMTKGGN
jgi:hypothetical protein